MTGTNSQSDQIQKIIRSDLFLSEIVRYRIYRLTRKSCGLNKNL